MARGVTGSGITCSLGRKCRRCGGDEWRAQTTKKNGREYKTHACAICNRRHQRENRARFTPAKWLWKWAQDRAAKSGVPFTITVKDVEAVWPKDNRCPVLGVPLAERGARLDRRPSLDRLNNAWGYEPGNIAVVSGRANRLKNDASAEELDKVAGWMRRSGLS